MKGGCDELRCGDGFSQRKEKKNEGVSQNRLPLHTRDDDGAVEQGGRIMIIIRNNLFIFITITLAL